MESRYKVPRHFEVGNMTGKQATGHGERCSNRETSIDGFEKATGMDNMSELCWIIPKENPDQRIIRSRNT